MLGAALTRPQFPMVFLYCNVTLGLVIFCRTCVRLNVVTAVAPVIYILLAEEPTPYVGISKSALYLYCDLWVTVELKAQLYTALGRTNWRTISQWTLTSNEVLHF